VEAARRQRPHLFLEHLDSPGNDLDDDDLWVLREVNDASGNNPVGLEYDVATFNVGGQTVKQLSLQAIHYNRHPSESCSKHKLYLTYEDPQATPYSMWVDHGHVRVRAQVIKKIEVLVRENGCGDDPVALRTYDLTYGTDADTKQPRLTAVDVHGRQGTAEAAKTLPGARYEYSSATKDGALTLEPATGVTLPTGAMAGTAATTGNGDYKTWQMLHDFTGDGRPDLVYKTASGVLQMAVNKVDATGVNHLDPAVSFDPSGNGDVPLHELLASSI